jgi:hypothetical protein
MQYAFTPMTTKPAEDLDDQHEPEPHHHQTARASPCTGGCLDDRTRPVSSMPIKSSTTHVEPRPRPTSR